MNTHHSSLTEGQTPDSNDTTGTNPSSVGKFVPTCRICKKKHWPLDPSCIGKKGAKAEAAAKVKAAMKR